MDDYELVARELSRLAEKFDHLEEKFDHLEEKFGHLDDRVAEVERVNARLEEAALTTARAMEEVSRHWDAVYDAMRRPDRIEGQISSERDHEAARARRAESSD